MIGYVTIGTNDLQGSASFYDGLMSEIGAVRVMDTEKAIMWGTAMDAPGLVLISPFDGNPATVGNGMMVALLLDSPEKVAAMHARAIELGGVDEGAPGARGEGGFYCGYCRDLDGNKLNLYCMT